MPRLHARKQDALMVAPQLLSGQVCIIPWFCTLHRFAVREKPVVLLPRVNHGHTSNGQVVRGRADLHADCSLEEASEKLAGVIMMFLRCHFDKRGYALLLQR